MRNPKICGAGGVINIQQDYRIVIPYRDSFCKLLRFSVARDGSVNFSPYLKGATAMLDQSLKADTKGSLSVKYGTGKLTSIEDMPDKNILKINYHASGFVHYGDKRAKAKPIREIEAECEIAMLTFPHPKEMELVNKMDIGRSDMVAQVSTVEICSVLKVFAGHKGPRVEIDAVFRIDFHHAQPHPFVENTAGPHISADPPHEFFERGCATARGPK